MIDLYGMSSPNVRKIVIALEEMGLEYTNHHVPVFRSGQFEPDFMALNPFSKVPVIVDRAAAAANAPVFESGAILIYLSETYAPAFYPSDAPQRYETLTWVMAQIANVGPIFGQHSHFRLIADQQPYAATRFRQVAARLYRILDDRLASHSFIAGDFYSIADMAMYPWARYRQRHGLPAAEFPALAAWQQRIGARPAVQRAAAIMTEWGKLDTADRRAATPADRDRLLWRHFPAPEAEAAATQRGLSSQDALATSEDEIQGIRSSRSYDQRRR